MLRGLGKNRYGRIDKVCRVIYVDYRQDLLAMFVHQCLHIIYPQMRERDVTILELIIVENMLPSEAAGLLQAIVDNSIHQLPGNPELLKDEFIRGIENLFDGGDWIIRLEQLRGETDLSIVHDLGRWCHGFMDENVYIMYVDFREDMLATFLHECIHALYPEKSEQSVKAFERRAISNISALQAEYLLRIMLKNVN